MEGTAQTRARPWIVAAILVAAAAVLPWAGALDGPFLHDDRWAVQDNPLVQGGVDVPRILQSNAWGNEAEHLNIPNYRPLSVLTLAVTRAVAGPEPLPFRATNVLAHACASLLLLLLLARLGLPAAAAGLGAAWFALHPVHAEAILFVVNREEILASGFYLAAAALWVPRLGLGSTPARPTGAGTAIALAGLTFLGLMAKETAATLPILAAAALVLWPPPRGIRARAWGAVGLAFAALGAYLLVRHAALGRLMGGPIPWQDNPLVREGLAGRWTGALVVVWEAVRLLVAPLHLTADYGWNVLGLPADGFPARAALGLAVVAGGLAALARWARRVPAAAFGLLLAAVAWSLFSSVAFPSSILLAERSLYLPSAGAAVLLAVGIERLGRRSARLPALRLGLGTLAAALLLAFGALAWDRAGDFASAERLFASSLANRPGSTRLHGNLGVALMDAGRWAAADRQLRTALVLDPTNAEAHHNLGLVLASAGRPREAEAEFREALALRPGMRVALTALCLLLEGRDRHEEALPVCDAAARKGADVACARWRIETGGRCLAPPADLSEPPPG